MSSILVAFPKQEDGKRIARLLSGYGFSVDHICTTAAQALSEMNQLSGGVIICGYRLPDMFFSELVECMPPTFEMLLVASERTLGQMDSSGVMALSMPLKACDLADAPDDASAEKKETYARPEKEKPEGTADDRLSQKPADGTESSDGGRGAPLSAEMQYGQRHQSGGDRTDGAGINGF